MGRNNADFDYGIEPSPKDVIRAQHDKKITWEEAGELSPITKSRQVAAHGFSTSLRHRDKEVPRIRPTSDKKIRDIHRNAGLTEPEDGKY